MDVLTVAAVLSLLSVSAAKPLNCEDLVQPVDPSKIQMSGHWIVIEGMSDHPALTEVLKTVESSVMDITMSSDNGTSHAKVRDRINGECHYYGKHFTFSNNTFHITERNDSVTSGVFLPTCRDCLVLSLTGVYAGDIGRSLYISGRTKKLNESDVAMFREQAKCLGLPQPSFKFDETQGLCAEEKPADTEVVESCQKC